MEQLLEMGFDESIATVALERTGGNLEAAIEYLFNMSSSQNSYATATSVRPNNEDEVIALEVSQFSFADAGSSACTAISVTVVKELLQRCHRSLPLISIEDLSMAMANGVTHYQQQVEHGAVESTHHLSVDELGPKLFVNLQCRGMEAGPIQGLLSNPSAFEEMFHQARAMADTSKHIGIIITKPPETVSIVLPPVARENGGDRRYLFFDSHSRPHLGFPGAYLVHCQSEEGIIRRLKQIFTALPVDSFGGADDDYMTAMYNMFEGSVFQLEN